MVTLPTIESTIAYLEVVNGILHITLKDEADLDVDEVIDMIEKRETLQKGEPMLVLADIRKIWQATRQARETAASQRMANLNIAMAIVTGSLASRMLANFFIKFNKPKTPTKMFNSKEKALVWLEQFR